MLRKRRRSGEAAHLRREEQGHGMIYYFSATGNSRHAAQQLGELLGLTCREITAETQPLDEPRCVVVFPVFFWGLPAPVVDFLRRGTWQAVDAVITCGGYVGTADRHCCELLPYALVRAHALPMETNYIIWHKVDSDDVIRSKLSAAQQQLPQIARNIREGKTSYQSPGLLKPLGKLFYLFYPHFRRTKPFHATDACTACGACARGCPDQAINMVDNKPKWVKGQCYHCLKCLHRCPVACIEYGSSTVSKKRYRFEGYAKGVEGAE